MSDDHWAESITEIQWRMLREQHGLTGYKFQNTYKLSNGQRFCLRQSSVVNWETVFTDEKLFNVEPKWLRRLLGKPTRWSVCDVLRRSGRWSPRGALCFRKERWRSTRKWTSLRSWKSSRKPEVRIISPIKMEFYSMTSFPATDSCIFIQKNLLYLCIAFKNFWSARRLNQHIQKVIVRKIHEHDYLFKNQLTGCSVHFFLAILVFSILILHTPSEL